MQKCGGLHDALLFFGCYFAMRGFLSFSTGNGYGTFSIGSGLLSWQVLFSIAGCVAILNLFHIILGIPGFSFDVMLMFFQNSEQSKTNDNLVSKSSTSKPPGSLDLYSDPEMEQFFTKGIRGGQSFISQSYIKGNNNPRKSGDHLLYIDGNFILYYLIKFVCLNLVIFQPTTCTGVWKL